MAPAIGLRLGNTENRGDADSPTHPLSLHVENFFTVWVTVPSRGRVCGTSEGHGELGSVAPAPCPVGDQPHPAALS